MRVAGFITGCISVTLVVVVLRGAAMQMYLQALFEEGCLPDSGRAASWLTLLATIKPGVSYFTLC